ncbi:MAG TPA: agmatine deiminase family protein [Kofleriaceae bacterium]|nr:agmatine deiminase family protein [Kofleriaceae bacterium]
MPHRLRRPAEWEPHTACFVAWPSHAEEWSGDLSGARLAWTALARAITDGGRGEGLHVLVLDANGESQARAALGEVSATFHHIPFGDIWLRDTGPIFVHAPGGQAAVQFRHTGWGGKYVLAGDDQVAAAVCRLTEVPLSQLAVAGEGGAIDTDGDGTALTTRSCLLSAARNPGASTADIEAVLAEALGIDRVVWLNDGLARDHTDGHVDTIARFVAPGVIACMEPAADDPNREVLAEILATLKEARDARGQRLEIATVPSPGAVTDAAGELLPASYVNFYIANTTVCVPTYGVSADDRAIDAIARFFPDRRIVAIDARAILAGGGAFHCITQEQPSP